MWLIVNYNVIYSGVMTKCGVFWKWIECGSLDNQSIKFAWHWKTMIANMNELIFVNLQLHSGLRCRLNPKGVVSYKSLPEMSALNGWRLDACPTVWVCTWKFNLKYTFSWTGIYADCICDLVWSKAVTKRHQNAQSIEANCRPWWRMAIRFVPLVLSVNFSWSVK